MNEAQVCTRLVNTFESKKHWAFKIPDMPFIKGAKFNRPKAVDIVAAIKCHSLLIEVKIGESLPRRVYTLLNLCTPSQWRHLDFASETTSSDCYLIFCEYKHARRPIDRRHSLFVFKWLELRGAKHDAFCDEFIFKVISPDKKLYNLNPLIRLYE